MKISVKILFIVVLIINCSVGYASLEDSLLLELKKTKGVRKAEILNKLAKLYMREKLNKSLELSSNALKIAIENNSVKDEAEAYSMIGLYYFHKSEFQKALSFFNKSFEKFTAIGDKVGIASSLNNKGLIYDQWGDFIKSLECYTKSLTLLEKANHTNGVSATLANISRIYFFLKEYDQAMAYIKKNIEIESQKPYSETIADSYNNLAIILVMQNKLYQAMSYFKIVLEINNKKENNLGIAGALHNIGNVYMRLNDYDNAYLYLNKALVLSKRIQDNSLIAETYLNLSELVFSKNQIETARSFAIAGLEVSKRINNRQQMISLNEILSQIYEKQKSPVKALEHYKMFKLLSDSVFTKDMQRQITLFNAKFETANKIKEIAILKNEKEIQELTIKKQWAVIIAVVLVIFLILVILFLIYKRYTTKKKTNIALESANIDLAASNAIKDKVFSIVVHDLNNPISAFTGLLSLIEKEYNSLDDDRKYHLIKKLSGSAYSLNELMKNITNWSKFKRGTNSIVITQIELCNVIQNVLHSLDSAIRAKNINVLFNCYSNPVVMADANLLFTVFYNVVFNAIKFSHPLGSIYITNSEESGVCKVQIKDCGVGISDDNLAGLFKIDSHITTIGTNKEVGTGLGLIICKEFIEKCNGTINISSKLGEGTIVTVTVDLA